MNCLQNRFHNITFMLKSFGAQCRTVLQDQVFGKVLAGCLDRGRHGAFSAQEIWTGTMRNSTNTCWILGRMFWMNNFFMKWQHISHRSLWVVNLFTSHIYMLYTFCPQKRSTETWNVHEMNIVFTNFRLRNEFYNTKLITN